MSNCHDDFHTNCVFAVLTKLNIKVFLKKNPEKTTDIADLDTTKYLGKHACGQNPNTNKKIQLYLAACGNNLSNNLII